jgi:hypothetical protein
MDEVDIEAMKKGKREERYAKWQQEEMQKCSSILCIPEDVSENQLRYVVVCLSYILDNPEID